MVGVRENRVRIAHHCAVANGAGRGMIQSSNQDTVGHSFCTVGARVCSATSRSGSHVPHGTRILLDMNSRPTRISFKFSRLDSGSSPALLAAAI